MTHPLDDPIWAALTTAQAGFAAGDARAKRFPADVAPFLALADADAEADGWVAPGEAISFIGTLPRRSGLAVELDTTLLQMTRTRETPLPAAAGVALGAADAADMVALTDVAFPGYFRPRTYLLGRYFGIRHEGRLVAMAGERLAAPGWREVSAVCTHPDHVGRGHARALMARILALHAQEGLTSFLHVSPANAGAIRLYEALGFAVRAELPLRRVRRDG